MNCRCLWIVLLHVMHSIPNDLDAFSIGNSVVNTITTQYNEVMLVLNLESFDFWSCYEDTFLPTKLF